MTVEEILKGICTDSGLQDSLPEVEGRINKHLVPYFCNRRAANVTTADIQEYVDKRQSAAANATINRELATLKRGFSLAVRGGTLISKPYIPMLKEDNVRKGFFEPEQLEAVLNHLNEDLKPIVVFAYITGWRTISEDFFRFSGGKSYFWRWYGPAGAGNDQERRGAVVSDESGTPRTAGGPEG